MKITEHIKKLISDVALKANKAELENKANVTDLANISTTSKTISNIIENADLTISNTVPTLGKLTHLYTGTGATNDLLLGSAKEGASELVSNGTFDSDVSGFTALTNCTLSWLGSGKMRATRTANSGERAFEVSVATTIGTVYTLNGDKVTGTGR